jgi:hypothetical protein
MAKINKNKKGSVLIFSIFIMMIALIMGIGIMTTATTQRRSTLTSSKTVYAFQLANDGLEAAFYTIKEQKVSLGTFLGHDIEDVFAACSGSEVPGSGYVLTFFTNPAPPASSVQLSCTDPMRNVGKIKSVGIHQNTSRAVESTIDLSGV